MAAPTSSYPLPYALNALEPVISEKTMTLHTGLAQNYRVNFPIAEKSIAANAKSPASTLRASIRDAAFQGSGWALHELYFMNMSPLGQGGTPGALTTRELTATYGSMDAFKTLFQNAAAAVEGPGWTVLGWHPALKRLLLLNAEEHQHMTIWGVLPILVLDVWEHAYLLDYGTARATYIKNWWGLINWTDVEESMRLVLPIQSPGAQDEPGAVLPVGQ